MLQLYDLAGIYYRAYHALPQSMVGPHGRPVNAIRGSLDMLARLIEEARPDRAVACLDLDWRPAWRVALIGSYKAHRVAEAGMTTPVPPDPGIAADMAGGLPAVAVDVEEAFSWQIPVLLEVLRAVGLAMAGAAGCEADDVIAAIVAAEPDTAIEIVSGDRDLYQLVRGGPAPVVVRYIGAGLAKMNVMDEAALIDRYGVDGPGYAAMAALRGDPSDGLPGVPGIGERTAARLVAQFGDLDAVVSAAQDPGSAMTARTRAAIIAATDYLAAAGPVVRAWAQAPVQYLGDPGPLPRQAASTAALERLIREHGIGRSVERLLGAATDR